jgi:hypothetical protein
MFHRRSAFALLAAISFGAAAQTNNPYIVDTSKSTEQTIKDIQANTAKIGSASSDARCTKCPSACETVCSLPAEKKCLAELKVEREKAFAACKKNGSL